MKLSPSIIGGLSLSAAVATFVVGTASADDEVPSESPSSFFPSFYPFTGSPTSSRFPSYPVDGCPDRHDDILDALLEAFGEENCVYTNTISEIKSFECEYTDPNWFRGYAKYDYYESTIPYHADWQPKELMVSDTNIYDYSGANWITFDEPQPEGSGTGECMRNEGFLGGIGYKRRNPEDAPVCDDTVGEFTVMVRGTEVTKTCDDYWKKGYRIRRKKCSKHEEVESNCPGICKKFEPYPYGTRCICKDNPFPFGKNGLMCADLEEQNADELVESCTIKPYRRNCPSFCNTSDCRKNF